MEIGSGLAARPRGFGSPSAGDENGEVAGKDAFFVGELLGELFEIDAADEFHGDEEHAADFAEMVSLDDVGVDEVGDELGLADEVLDELLVARVVLADDLDGDALDEVARAVLRAVPHTINRTGSSGITPSSRPPIETCT